MKRDVDRDISDSQHLSRLKTALPESICRPKKLKSIRVRDNMLKSGSVGKTSFHYTERLPKLNFPPQIPRKRLQTPAQQKYDPTSTTYLAPTWAFGTHKCSWNNRARAQVHG